MRVSLLILLLWLFATLVACSTAAVNGDKQAFPNPRDDFAAHREEVYQYLKSNRMRSRSEADTVLNLPFEIKADSRAAYRGKFLLFHGLNDSSYVWTDMAKALSQRGFDVRAVLLPGHGAHPQLMLDISYREWLKAARAHYTLWQVDDTPIYLGGFSLGGVVATLLALENPDIAGLLLFSPAYHSRLNAMLQWSWLYALWQPWMFGGMIIEDNPIKYNSIPINSGTQYYLTTKQLKHRWRGSRLDIPVMVVVTADDSVVDVEYTRNLFQHRFPHPRNRLLLYTNNPDTVARDRELVRSSRYPERRILNQSHLSLLNAPDNPLFGENAQILVCNGNEYPVFMACMRAQGHWFGAQHTPSPDGVPVARTTYNPDFSHVLNVVEQVFLSD